MPRSKRSGKRLSIAPALRHRMTLAPLLALLAHIALLPLQALHAEPPVVYQPSKVKDINPTGGSDVDYLTEVNGTIFFTADDGVLGRELWKSDGTSEGTVLVKDINPGPDESSVVLITSLADKVVFKAEDGTNGREPWVSDGSAAGTFMLKDIEPGAAGSHPNEFVNVNGTMFFIARDGFHNDLWKTDGTSAGTMLVKDFSASFSNNLDELTDLDGTLVFSGFDASNGLELWKSDGTQPGTTLVTNIRPGSGWSTPGGLTVMGGEVYFSAFDGTNGIELWKSDGTGGGTTMVKDIHPSSNSTPGGLTAVDNTLYFRANDGATGSELWKSDGTAAGTALVKDITPGPGHTFTSSVDEMGALNGKVLVPIDDGSNGMELWTSDGTGPGTFLLKDIDPGAASGLTSRPRFRNLDDKSYFRASDATRGLEIWRTDGTEAGTVRLTDINPGTGGAELWWFLSIGPILYFNADDGTGTELWRMDTSPPPPPTPIPGMTGVGLAILGAAGLILVLWRSRNRRASRP